MDTKFLKLGLRGLAIIVLLAMLPGGAFSAVAAPGDMTRVSVDSSGAQADGGSRRPAISEDGRFVAFTSEASNLVAGDTNGVGDIFLRDRQTGTTTRISVDSSGGEADGGSSAAAISADGRYVAFYSEASNLVDGDTNGFGDIFVHDRQTGLTQRVSVDSSGMEANAPPADDYAVLSISGNGRYVAFYSDASNLVGGDTNNAQDIFVHDLQTGQTIRASLASDGSEANAGSSHPNLSGDGRFVTFSSSATNLVAGDTNGKGDVFVRDLQSGSTTRVSINSSGEQADAGGSSPDISGDGRFVVFLSNSNNLAPRTNESQKPLVYVRDRQVGQTTLASVYSHGDIMVTGILDEPTISSNGRYVAFAFYDKGENQGIMNIWVRDLQNGTSVEATYGNGSSFWPALSADGSVVAFWSGASNLVSGDTNGANDIFVREVAYGAERSPTVVSITPKCGWYVWLCPVPTPASVSFIVIFSEQVSGVTADDFALTMLEGVSGASITAVSGSGSEYFVTVDTGTGDGKLRLDLIDNDSIIDSALQTLGGTGPENGNFTTGVAYWIIKGFPAVDGIFRADPNPTSAQSVNFVVAFSKAVSGVDASDFALAVNGGLSGASVVNVSGADHSYTVTVNTGAGDGTLRLDLIDDDSILDATGNPLGGPGAGNGNFTTGEAYTVSRSAPSVTGILRADPNPTLAEYVNFSVMFSESISGLDPGDFVLTTTGSVNGAFVVTVIGSGNTYSVTVHTGSGDGGLRLDLLDDDSIVSASGTPLGGPGAGNGNFSTGEAYMLDKTAPFVSGDLRADPNPTAANQVNFTVVFSETVSGVDVSDFFVTATGSLSGASVLGVSGSGYLYTVTAGTGSGDGTLRLDLLDNDTIVDGVGHPLGGAGIGNGNYVNGEVYTFNRKPVEKFTDTIRSNGFNDGWVLESSEDSNQGGFKDSSATTFVLGDNAQDSQFRAILHFPTHYIPNNAVITRALIMLKGESIVGTDPFTTHQNIVVDIRSGAFGFIGPFPFRGLQISDFQSPSHRDAVGMIENNPFNGWYWAWLDSSAFEYINLNGITQIRLRFQLDDDDNLSNDYIRFYSGDYADIASRPRLVIEYYTR